MPRLSPPKKGAMQSLLGRSFLLNQLLGDF